MAKHNVRLGGIEPPNLTGLHPQARGHVVLRRLHKLGIYCNLVQRQLEAAKSKTTSVCAIYDYQLVKIQIPLPPLEKQRRIAAILDKADAVRRKRQKAIALTEELLRAAFLEMFGDPVTNPKGWHTERLGDLAQFVGGGTPSRQKAEYYQGDICWATPKDMRVDVLTKTEEHITLEAIEQIVCLRIWEISKKPFWKNLLISSTPCSKPPFVGNYELQDELSGMGARSGIDLQTSVEPRQNIQKVILSNCHDY